MLAHGISDTFQSSHAATCERQRLDIWPNQAPIPLAVTARNLLESVLPIEDAAAALGSPLRLLDAAPAAHHLAAPHHLTGPDASGPHLADPRGVRAWRSEHGASTFPRSCLTTE